MLNMKEVRRIVVKVGSSTLTYDNGKPDYRYFCLLLYS